MLLLTLVRLCEGDLAGMVDRLTSEGIDFTAPLVALDMSALYQSEALGILMVCAQARIPRAPRRPGPERPGASRPPSHGESPPAA